MSLAKERPGAETLPKGGSLVDDAATGNIVLANRNGVIDFRLFSGKRTADTSKWQDASCFV